MNQQDELEARYREQAAKQDGDIPRHDPFPRMIVVCIAITMALLFIIMGFLFFDFVIRRPAQNVRQAPVRTAPAPPPAPAPSPATLPGEKG